ETTFGVDQSQGVRMVAFLETTDLRSDCGDRSRSVRTEHIREACFRAEYFGEFAFAFEWIPHPHTGRFDAEQNFIWPGFGHGDLFHLNVFDAAETVERGGTHG